MSLNHEAIRALYPQVVTIIDNTGIYDADGGEVVVDSALVNLKSEQLQAEKQRAAAYTVEADPLFFKAQRGEVNMDDWTAKVEEIRQRYPYPAE